MGFSSDSLQDLQSHNPGLLISTTCSVQYVLKQPQADAFSSKMPAMTKLIHRQLD